MYKQHFSTSWFLQHTHVVRVPSRTRTLFSLSDLKRFYRRRIDHPAYVDRTFTSLFCVTRFQNFTEPLLGALKFFLSRGNVEYSPIPYLRIYKSCIVCESQSIRVVCVLFEEPSFLVESNQKHWFQKHSKQAFCVIRKNKI